MNHSGSFNRLLENYAPMKIKEEVRTPHNYDVDKVSDATGLSCPEPTRTQQQFLQESDINFIADRFLKTGELPQVVNMPSAGDFEGIFDFQSAMNLITEAKQEFMNLPAKIRSRFDNDPAKLIEFLEDPANNKEAEILGLRQPPKEVPPNGPASEGSTQATTEARSRAAGAAPAPRPAGATEKPGSKADEGNRGGD